MKLISWNIQRGRWHHGTCNLERVAASLRQMADADVLCLQEVSAGYTDLPGSDGRNQFIELAALLPEYTALAGINTDTRVAGGTRRLFGNMTLSRHPVLQVLRHALPWPVDAAAMSMQRGAIEATIDTPCGLLRVVNTHLEYFSPIQRAAQVERLRELHRDAHLQALATPPGERDNGPFCAVPRAAMALLAGDFNFLPQSAQYWRLQAPFDEGVPAWQDAWGLTHPGQPHAPTVCVHDDTAIPYAFDFVFASAGLARHVRSMRVVEGHFGSDHQPLLIELT
ncbi:endonuclease/exonuclease/phosphatase family protein [Massilia sp. PAMC28688]|uniref:endonuclease/exonuclease/phosphatase family protein n=1 Tax=Massilia sp. PAMC28688 TaxID=2861283 RepID=UPI001C63A295|nr:endonuclease/exonuclease/phosphatase family protein [Massilia sp. PAMC28688]QYF92328.1 endonuclease/exonuclease/phosphatase family protein [Massilia sp. PAMC28688]